MRSRILWGCVILWAMGSGCVCADQDFSWENISRQIEQVNCVWVDEAEPKTIFLATKYGVFKSEDGGDKWQRALTTGRAVNFIYVVPKDKTKIFALTEFGLFQSKDTGKSWQRIFYGRDAKEANCVNLIITDDGKIYLGTQAGLFVREEGVTNWTKLGGKLGNAYILALSHDRINNLIYVVTPNGVYKIKQGQSYERIFIAKANFLDTETEEEAKTEKISSIRHIALEPRAPQILYLATRGGIYKSEDAGRSWNPESSFGLLTKKTKFLLISSKSRVFVVTDSGIFNYDEKKHFWNEVSLRLITKDIRFLAMDNNGNLYAATDKGLFVTTDCTEAGPVSQSTSPVLICTARRQGLRLGCHPPQTEPTIQQVQQAAIKYAQVIDPEKIEALRRGARLKAILPDFSLDYDKTISSYSNSKSTRFTVGPRDWGVSLKWNLSDLIWSDQQRLIDSQVRLMVQLRNDILDQVTKLYFERKRLNLELASKDLTQDKRQEKQLRLEELSASLDALTGGYFSLTKRLTP